MTLQPIALLSVLCIVAPYPEILLKYLHAQQTVYEVIFICFSRHQKLADLFALVTSVHELVVICVVIR